MANCSVFPDLQGPKEPQVLCVCSKIIHLNCELNHNQLMSVYDFS